ncbi:MAG: lauroyl acyltransferase [Pseudomonadota bacterium]
MVEAVDEPRAVAPQKRKRRRRRKPGDQPSFREMAEYALVRVVGLPLRHLPVDATSWAMGSALGLIMPLTSRHSRALDNLAHALPELSVEERSRIAKRMWQNLGRVSAEAFAIDRLIDATDRVDVPDDFDRFVALCQDGAICATPHLGNWEIAGALPRRVNLAFCGVYRELQNPLVEAYLKGMRAPGYSKGLFAKGPALGNTLVRLAREGVGIGMAADFRELRGVPVRFFGQEATGTPLPAMLARLSGRPLISGAILRGRGVRFRVVMREIEVSRTDERDRDIQETTQRLHDAFEEWIRLAPDQWMWPHRKWARSRRASPERISPAA